MGSVGWFNFSPFHLIVEKRSHPLQANDLARHNLGVSTSCYCWCFRNPTDFSTCYLWKPYKKWDTPLKTTIDTINCHLFKGVTFSTPSFWVSMLVFGSVVSISTAARFLNHQQYGNGKSSILHLSVLSISTGAGFFSINSKTACICPMWPTWGKKGSNWFFGMISSKDRTLKGYWDVHGT